MFGLIVQSGPGVVLAAATRSAHHSTAAFIPIVILLAVLYFASRMRRGRGRGGGANGRGAGMARPERPTGPERRPRSAREAMSASPAAWESDTETPPSETPASGDSDHETDSDTG